MKVPKVFVLAKLVNEENNEFIKRKHLANLEAINNYANSRIELRTLIHKKKHYETTMMA